MGIKKITQFFYLPPNSGPGIPLSSSLRYFGTSLATCWHYLGAICFFLHSFFGGNLFFCLSIELQSKVRWHKSGHLVAPLGGQFAHLLCSDNIKGAVKNTRTHSTFLKPIGEGSLA